MRFYVLVRPKPGSAEDLRGGIDAIKEKGFRTGPAPTCAACDGFIGKLTWLPPYRIELETWGREYGDVDQPGNDLIVSDRFIDMFRKEDLQGLTTFDPVEVIRILHRRKKPQEAPPCYFKSTVKRTATTVDQEASGFEWEDSGSVCPVCLTGQLLKRFRRIIIRPETWSGEDVFFPKGSSQVIVTERFKAGFELAGLRGGVFFPAEDYGYDYYPWESQAEAR